MKTLHLPRVSFFLSILSAALLAPRSLAADLFVDATLTTGANDGSSWSDAFQGTGGVTDALAAAASGDRVFVAQGTYLPSLTGAQGASFVLPHQVEIFGGFLGGEASPDERPSFGSAPTVLSGDLNGDDPTNILENSFHVIRVTGNALPVLDGFMVMGGNAQLGSSTAQRGGGMLCDNGARPVIRNCGFHGNVADLDGGACSSMSAAAPTFVACSFIDNSAGSSGGALYRGFGAGSIRIERCHFERNRAAEGGAIATGPGVTTPLVIAHSTFVDNRASGVRGGGAMAHFSTAPCRVDNCTLVANSSVLTGGGGIAVTIGASNTSIANSILWGNQGPALSQTFSSQVFGLPFSAISYSIVESLSAGTGNQNVDPHFVDLAGGDLRLQLSSTAIDAGDNFAVPAPAGGGPQVDLDGFRRFQDEPSVPDTGVGGPPVVDIGAFEYTTLIGRPYCSSPANSTGMAARIDATGSTSVASNSVTLTATLLPQHVAGYFLTSRVSGHVPDVGGSSGTLCLGGEIGRFNSSGQILSSGTSGEFSLALDLTTHPTPTGPVAVLPGETWRFQAWFRDSSTLGFATSNLTEGIAVTFD